MLKIYFELSTIRLSFGHVRQNIDLASLRRAIWCPLPAVLVSLNIDRPSFLVITKISRLIYLSLLQLL